MKQTGNLMKWINPMIVAALMSVSFTTVQADEEVRKLVVHVPQDDPKSLVQALNIASNVPKALGMDNVIVEVVAQGPGLKLLTTESAHAERVQSLVAYDVTFSACGNTMAAIERKTGKKPVLLEGVQRVDAGIIRVMELQEQGYSYVRP
jgi:intracellular sulfur oxidation DsrE/DsrF family protein